MMIIFQCYGGTHTSVAAASYYLGLLPRHRPPHADELVALPHFDRLGHSKMGHLHYVGSDLGDNPVFVLGSGRWRRPLQEVIRAYLYRDGRPATAPVALIDCAITLTAATRLGGFLSRRLGWTSLGRPLVCRGIRRAYRSILAQVEDFEKNTSKYLIAY